ncbi:RNA polymerase sigma factor [Rubrivirga sp. IMCC43871]|uniref:RNA polymerase sigma factor n=1 Tax=Rubrivirga sp. IMCC43871 TaxID=3391575 RepID=UPI00398FB883
MPPDDPALIDAFRQGDEFAFVALYDRYKGAVYGYCAKMLLDKTAAEDLLQETFARAYEHRGRLLNTTSFKAWLFTIARNQCLNALRKRGREVGFEPDAPEPTSPGVTPFGHLLRSEQAALVSRTLDALSPSYREVVVLREYQNLSYAEIAAVTKSTVSAVKSRLFKARREIGATLRPLLHPDEAPGPAVVPVPSASLS